MHNGGDEANFYSCCCSKHDYSKPKCHNLEATYVQLYFVSVQIKNFTNKLQKFPPPGFLQTRIMVDGAKFNSHDSGGHF